MRGGEGHSSQVMKTAARKLRRRLGGVTKCGQARALVAVLVLVLPTLGVIPAIAGDAASNSGASSSGVHCAYWLQPMGLQRGSGPTPATLVSLGCFESASESLFVGTRGALRIPERLAGESLTQQVLDSYGAGVASSFLIGREYDDTNYSDLIYELFAGAACTNTTGWTVGYVGNALNDRFESGKGFSNCDHNYKFEHSQFGEPRLHCAPNCSTYSSLRNEVSSLKYLGFTI